MPDTVDTPASTTPATSDKRASFLKGVRDIASGLFVFILMAGGAAHLVGWVILAARIIPIADALIVLGNGGAKAIALGVHGVTAVVMFIRICIP